MTVCVCDCASWFRDVITCSLRGEGRWDWEDLRFGVKNNHIITLESIALFSFTYILPLYIYLDYTKAVNCKGVPEENVHLNSLNSSRCFLKNSDLEN